MEWERVTQIVDSKVGTGKKFETPQAALDACNDYIAALGPVALIGGGFWGISFSILIPELEARIEEERGAE